MKSFLLSALIFLSAFAGLTACASKDAVHNDAPNVNRQDNKVSTTTNENGIAQNQIAANKFAADNRKKNLPIVKPSGIVEELIKLQAQNKNVAAADIVKAGNELAKTHGYKYVFENCPLIKKNDDSENEAQTNNLKPFYYKMTKTDGKKIYFENVPADLEGLVYEISEDGTIRFTAKDDAKIIKGEELEGYPKTSEISYKKFKAKDKEFIVKFSYPCT